MLAISIGAVYGRALEAPLIFDDDIAIVKNTSIKSLWPPIGTAEHPGPLYPAPDLPTSSRPLVNLSFALNYRLGTLEPVGYHLINILIHFGSAILLWAWIRRVLRLPYFGDRFAGSAGWLALGVSLLWSLHPIQTEAVAYASQRTELMMAFFYLATMYCSLRYWSDLPLPPGEGRGEGALDETPNKRRRLTWLTLAVFACLCGMASKEVMVSAPLMVLLFERTFVAGSLAKALRRSWPLHVCLASTWILLIGLILMSPRGNSAGFNLGVTPYEWMLTQSKVLLMYFKLVVWPTPLLIHYQLPYLTSSADAWQYALPVLLLGLITLVLLWRNRPLGFLGAWIFAILSPTLVVPIITETAAERRMYLPLAAIVVLFVVGGYMLVRFLSVRMPNPRQSNVGLNFPLAAIAVPVVLLALAAGLASFNRIGAYQNELSLWDEVLRYQPNNPIAHLNEGFIFNDTGNASAATQHFREAVRLDPANSLGQFNLGVMLIKSGAYDEAITHLEAAARRAPNDVLLRINLAGALIFAARYTESIQVSREALKIDPDNWVVYNNLGQALEKAGHYPQAIDALQQALRLNPQALNIYGDIADIHLLAKKPVEALAALERGLELARHAGDTKNAERFAARLKKIRDAPPADSRP